MSETRGRCEELTTLHRVYGERASDTELTLPVAAFRGPVGEGPDLYPGAEVVLYDEAGNEVRGVVKRPMVVVVPDWETFDTPRASRGQESML